MRPKSCSPCGSLSSLKLSNARILARIKRRESEARDSKPAVTTTVPPINERRKASLSARIRTRESALSAVIFNLKEFVQRKSTHARRSLIRGRGSAVGRAQRGCYGG